MSQDKISLSLETRTVEGKAVKHLRKEGIVPAVLHDHGKDVVMIQGDTSTVLKAYRQAGKHHPIELTIAGKSYTVMIKSIEFEPRKQNLNHVVFNAVAANEKVEAEVPLHVRFDEGNESSPAERNGLFVLPHLTSVVVKAVSSKLPDAIEYDGEKLVEVGDSITVADLVLPAGVEMVSDETQVIVTVNDPTVIAEANEAAGGDAEPGDEQAVESDTMPDTVEENTDGDEIRPGGKEQKESHDQGVNPEKQ